MYGVVREVQACKHTPRVEQLCNGAHASVRYAVVTEVEVRDGQVVDEARSDHSHAVVVEHVAAQVQVRESLRSLEALRQASAVGQLHAEQRAVVVHAHVAHAVREAEAGEAGCHNVEDNVEVEVARQLLQSDGTDEPLAEYKHALQSLCVAGCRVEALERVLEVSLEVQLLPRASVRRAVAVAPPCVASPLPVAFVFDKCANELEGQVERQQVDDFLDVQRRQSTERGVCLEVVGNHLHALLFERDDVGHAR